jgi:hypothetical protein
VAVLVLQILLFIITSHSRTKFTNQPLYYRDNTIQKWFDKTRLATGKLKSKSFSAFDQSALVQINQILADKERLIKRTQLKRSVYRVLGTVPTKDQPETVPSGEVSLPVKSFGTKSKKGVL